MESSLLLALYAVRDFNLKKVHLLSILFLRRDGPAIGTEAAKVLTRCLSQRTYVNAENPFLFGHLEHLGPRYLGRRSFYVIAGLCWDLMNMTFYKLLIKDSLGEIKILISNPQDFQNFSKTPRRVSS